MKVLFVFQGVDDTPNYYSHVLERLHGLGEVELLVVAGRNEMRCPGRLVAFREDDLGYRFAELHERDIGDGHWLIPGLWRVLLRERPEVVVTVPEYLKSFKCHLPLRMAQATLGISLILKSIPFRVPVYHEFRLDVETRYEAALAKPSRPLEALRETTRRATGLMAMLAGRAYGLGQRLRRARAARRTRRLLETRKALWCFPDAHVNYLDEAATVYGSYGVPRERFFVIRNSPDTVRLFDVRAELEREGNVVRHPRRLIHVGRLVDWKRVDLLLEAFASVRRAFADAELLVIGEGPKLDEWRQQAEDLAVDDSVCFAGGIYDSRELARMMMGSGVYVLAGMGGLSINDAMCFGLPVVCSVCDGTERFLVRPGENGYFFAEGDAGDLADKILDILADPQRQASMGRRSTEIIREDINVWTVHDKYIEAFEFVRRRPLREAREALAVAQATVPATAEHGSNGEDSADAVSTLGAVALEPPR